MPARTRIGVLALQGAFAAHIVVLKRLGAEVREVRLPVDLAECDALVMPGGESTTMSKLLESSALFDPIAKRIDDGMPVFGTCAGMILLAREVLDGRPDQRSFGAIDIAVQRNAYGRQVDSFETDIAVGGLDDAFHAVFIRAPRITRCGAGVTHQMAACPAPAQGRLPSGVGTPHQPPAVHAPCGRPCTRPRAPAVLVAGRRDARRPRRGVNARLEGERCPDTPNGRRSSERKR
ncbi:MAG: Glutamine amidotransferase subunit PdxT [Actinomycetota bacterium]